MDWKLEFIGQARNTCAAQRAETVDLITSRAHWPQLVELGGTEAKPDYGYPGWFAMLFAAGMGIDTKKGFSCHVKGVKLSFVSWSYRALR